MIVPASATAAQFPASSPPHEADHHVYRGDDPYPEREDTCHGQRDAHPQALHAPLALLEPVEDRWGDEQRDRDRGREQSESAYILYSSDLQRRVK